MLKRLLKSKVGFTLVELLLVVSLLAILTAVAIPVFNAGLEIQKRKDCKNNCVVIEAAIQQVMSGMVDNGRKQDKMDFSQVAENRKTTYNGKDCLILKYDNKIYNDYGDKYTFTIGDIRGGYFGQEQWNAHPELTKSYGPYDEYNVDKYDIGCDYGYYLKKNRYKDNQFYYQLANEEIPVCPCANYENDKDKIYDDNYCYLVFEDGTVMCNCPHCSEAE